MQKKGRPASVSTKAPLTGGEEKKIINDVASKAKRGSNTEGISLSQRKAGKKQDPNVLMQERGRNEGRHRLVGQGASR